MVAAYFDRCALNLWYMGRMKLRYPATVLAALVTLAMTVPTSGQEGKKAEPTAATPLIPMRDFFRNPETSGYDLSPDGTHLAFMKPWKNRMNVHVQKMGSEEAVRVTSAEERDIAGFAWASDSRIVFIQDTGGDENFRLYAVDADGKNPKDLTPFDEVRVGVIDDLEDDPKHMLISINKRDKRFFDAYRINVDTAELELLVENPGNYSGYVTDHDGKLRMITTTDGVNTGLLYRADESGEFKQIIETNFKETLDPLFFTYDNKKIYASSNLGRDKASIVVFNPETAKEEETIFEHPEVDVSRLLSSDKKKTITGVSYTTDKRAYKFFDKEREELQAYLEAQLPGVEVGLADLSKDETKYLVRTYSDRTLGAYYFFDTADKKLIKLAEVSPWLNADQMAEMKPVSYKSRDGLTIHGYLTLPKGVEPKNLPVIVNVHGGPWVRDHWGFDPEVQFLANRGYAVLQMNYRGSTGYGRAFWEASFKKWGQEMQNDVTDGARWLISEGIADPKRVGIYGGSYGGYATLAGLAYTPDLYACGVDYVGVSNLLTFMKAIPPYWEQFLAMMYEQVGNPEDPKDLKMLEAYSPALNADKIKAPLFIAQGANDPRVVKSESDQMVEGLRKRGVNVPYMVKDDEGHGFHNEENRFDFYRAMEQFLALHLKGRKEEGAENKLPAAG
jgi:dipeptidyl aminopeptidase/acylaminoacyl peptidase